jgi:hypothetical protein
VLQFLSHAEEEQVKLKTLIAKAFNSGVSFPYDSHHSATKEFKNHSTNELKLIGSF